MSYNMRSAGSANAYPTIIHRPNAKSSTFYLGDPVVYSTYTSLTTSSNPVARSLVAADIAALYENGSGVKCGILGFCAAEGTTDSSGIASSPVVYSGKAASATARYALPTIGASLPVDTTTGYTMMKIFGATPDDRFKGKLKSTLTASNLMVGAQAGIDLTSSTFTIDTGATTKILVIDDWDPIDTTWVYFHVMPAFCQLLTGIPYTAQ